MSNVIIPHRYLVLGNTSGELAAENGIAFEREMVIEQDTRYFKLGDGSTAYNSLPYAGIYPASMIPIADAGGYFVGTTVEAALQELGAGGGGGGGLDPSAHAETLWDFTDSGFATSTATGSAFVTTQTVPVVYTSGTSGANGTLASSEPGHPGIVRLSTGTTTTGYARMFFTPGKSVVLGGGQQSFRFGIRIPMLSTSTERFTVRIGLGNVINGGGGQYVAADYSDNINSGNWSFIAIDGSGTTTQNSAIAPAANTWFPVEVVVNAAGTSAELRVGGVNLGTVAANIPTGDLGITVWMSKNTGTSNRSLDVDYASWSADIDTPR